MRRGFVNLSPHPEAWGIGAARPCRSLKAAVSKRLNKAMRRLLVALGLALAALGVLGVAIVAADQPLPKPTGYVSDFAGVLTDDVKSPLEDALRLFEQE